MKAKVINLYDKPEPLKSKAIKKQEKGLEVKKTYYKEGSIRTIVHYKNGKKHGSSEWYDWQKVGWGDRVGNLRLRGMEYFKDGQLHGTQTIYNLNVPEVQINSQYEWIENKCIERRRYYKGKLRYIEKNRYNNGHLEFTEKRELIHGKWVETKTHR